MTETNRIREHVTLTLDKELVAAIRSLPSSKLNFSGVVESFLLEGIKSELKKSEKP